MKLDAAKAECERWFAHLDGERQRAIEMQCIASDRRADRCTHEEAQLRVRALDRKGLVVFDGANLEQAVKVLLRELAKK